MSLRSLQTAALLLLATSALHAEALKLSLDDAVRMALGRGTQTALARSAEERARIARTEALSGLLPQADARVIKYNQSINLATFGFTLPGFPEVVGPFNVIDGQIAAAMQLFNLAAIRHYQAVQQGMAASRYATEQAENDVTAAVARLYLLAQRAQTQIGSREADVALFERLLKMAEDEFAAGTGTRLDVAQARVQVARARQALLTARNDRETAVLALLNAIGANEADDVTLTDIPPASAAVPTADTALGAARANRPELKEAAAREKEASLAYEAQHSRLAPNLGLDFLGDYSGNKSNDLHWTRRIAATVGMPLFHGDINAAIARARADLHDAQIERAQRERDVEQDVRRAIFALQNAQERVAVAREAARVADEALTVARDRRAAGYGSPVEVDRAQDQYRQAREDVIAAEADAAAAQFDLEHATGGIHRWVEERR
jgi:outer membrane protein TolC